MYEQQKSFMEQLLQNQRIITANFFYYILYTVLDSNYKRKLKFESSNLEQSFNISLIHTVLQIEQFQEMILQENHYHYLNYPID